MKSIILIFLLITYGNYTILIYCIKYIKVHFICFLLGFNMAIIKLKIT